MVAATLEKETEAPPADDRMVPPRDFDAEQAVLGSMLLEPGAVSRALEICSPDDFYWEDHQLIAAATVRCHDRNEPVDLTTVGAELRRQVKLNQVGGGAYLMGLISSVPTAAHVVRYATIVAERAVLRRLIDAGSKMMALGYGNPEDVGAAITKATALLQPMNDRLRPPAAPTLRTFADLELLPPPSWAWPGWLANGHVSMLFGPPGAGKSYLALALCGPMVAGWSWPDGQIAGQERSPALLLDYEMTQRATLDRAKGMGLPLHMLLTQPEDQVPYLTRTDSFDIIRGWLEQSRARLLIIDSLRDALPGVDENDAGAVSTALHPLKLLAQEFDCSILLLHHCRKQPSGGEGQQRWELTMDDLRGSSAIAGAVRNILAIDKPDANRDTRRLKIVKSNFAAMPEPLGFDLAGDGLAWTAAPFAGRDMPQRSAAEEAIRIALQARPMRFSELQRELEAGGISKRTMLRALKSVAIKGTDGRWKPMGPG